MLDGFQVLPAELSGLGFDLPDPQLSLAAEVEGYALTWTTVADLVDPYGLGSIDQTSNGVSLYLIKVPVIFAFDDSLATSFYYERGFEDWLDDRWYGHNFWDTPKHLGVVDIPWHDHVLCGCGDDEAAIDGRPLWSLWPVSETHLRVIGDALWVMYEEFICPASKLIMEDEYSDPAEFDEAEHESNYQRLFHDDGRLRVHSTHFDLDEFTDDKELLGAWSGLLRSDRINQRQYRRLFYPDYSKTG